MRRYPNCFVLTCSLIGRITLPGRGMLPLISSPRAEFGALWTFAFRGRVAPSERHTPGELGCKSPSPCYKHRAQHTDRGDLCLRAGPAAACLAHRGVRRGWGAGGLGAWGSAPGGVGGVGQQGGGFLVLLPRRRDGGSSCVGPARRHRSCQIEVKPTGEGETSFLDPLPADVPGCLPSVPSRGSVGSH